MQMSKYSLFSRLAASALVLGLTAGAPASAFDPEKTFKPDTEPRMILRFGFQALKKGNIDDAIGAFRFGAEKNDLASQWKLAHMLQNGDGLLKDELASYRLYRKIADRFASQFPAKMDLPYVSHAVVSLGLFELRGIDGTEVVADQRRAEDHFYRAAALYKDREAQYQLGSLYRRGIVGVKQPRSAVRWLGLSARKGHPLAQAELGEMLFNGEGVSARPVRGLVFLAKASAKSAGSGLSNIVSKQRELFRKATKGQRKAAMRIIRELNLTKPNEPNGFALELVDPNAKASKASASD